VFVVLGGLVVFVVVCVRALGLWFGWVVSGVCGVFGVCGWEGVGGLIGSSGRVCKYLSLLVCEAGDRPGKVSLCCWCDGFVWGVLGLGLGCVWVCWWCLGWVGGVFFVVWGLVCFL